MVDLEKEFQYYEENRARLLEEHSGKVLAIKGQKVIGVYFTEVEALEKTSEIYEIGTFLIQFVDPSEENQIQVFHSRVTFS